MKSECNDGSLFVITGTTSSGKDTIVNEVFGKQFRSSDVGKIVSYTSREKRKGEVDGRDYYFISESTFDGLRNLIVPDTVDGKKYGTCAESIGLVLGGLDMVWGINISGASRVEGEIRKAFNEEETDRIIGNMVIIVIGTDSLFTLRDRFIRRASESGIERGMASKSFLNRIRGDWKAWNDWQFRDSQVHVVINNEIGAAVEKVRRIVEIHRAARRQVVEDCLVM